MYPANQPPSYRDPSTRDQYYGPPPKRGLTQSQLLIIGGSVLTGLAVIGTAAFLSLTSRHASAAPAAVASPATATAPTVSVTALPKSPEDADKLVTQLLEYRDEYRSASKNEARQSNIFRQARAFEKQFFSGSSSVKDWEGRLVTVKTDKGGNSMYLIVAVCSGSFCIDFTQSDVPHSSPVFNQVADGDLGEKDCVRFSARVSPTEDSITESGAMTLPEYKTIFTAVLPCR